MKLEVGAGAHPKAGYKHLDIAAGPGIDFVCPAWKTSLKSGSVAEIYARHFLEHLSQKEADQTLAEWRRLLVAGGAVHVIVPNLGFHGAQLLLPGNSEFFTHKAVTNLDHALFSIYGWPGAEAMRHKWGYTPATLQALFVRHNFVAVTIVKCRACDTELRARKANK